MWCSARQEYPKGSTRNEADSLNTKRRTLRLLSTIQARRRMTSRQAIKALRECLEVIKSQLYVKFVLKRCPR